MKMNNTEETTRLNVSRRLPEFIFRCLVTFFASYVRVLSSSIGMSSSTVKIVFGPPGWQIVYRKDQAFSNRLRQFPGTMIRVFRPHAKVFAACALLSFAGIATINAQTLDARISIVST